MSTDPARNAEPLKLWKLPEVSDHGYVRPPMHELTFVPQVW